MLLPVQKKLIYIFFILVILDIAGIAANIEPIHQVIKPMLIPALLILLFFSRSNVTGKNLLFMGLLFSWMGDVFLLFDDKLDLFFIYGLAAFLTTHIFYIIYFLRIRSAQSSLLKKQPIFIALILAYGVCLVWQLYPYLGDLKIPVIVYAAVICMMLLCSMHVFLKVTKKAGAYYLMGATAFVISDTLLAVNKFYQAFAFSSIFIMLTYCAAQYFIVRGFIEQDNL